MNWVDLVIILTLLSFAVEGLRRSFILELIELLTFIASLLISLRTYNLFAKLIENQFNIPHSFANVLGFISAWFVVETILFYLAQNILGRIKKIPKVPVGFLISCSLSALRGLVFIAIFLVLVGTFPIQPQIKKNINQSKIGSVILSKTYQLEGPLKGIFGGLADDTLTFLTVKPKSNESVGLGFKNDKFFFDEKMESAMIDLVNKERTAKGLQPLKYKADLQKVARNHSSDMFKRGYFSHYSPEGKSVADRADADGVDYMVIGENLAFAPSLELAHKGLMNSEGHRANILSTDYKSIGIGVANGDEFGIMFTQVFSD